MQNGRRNTGRNLIGIMFALFHFCAGVFMTHAYASNETVDTATVDCRLIKPESYAIYRFVDSKYHKGLQVFHDAICKRVEDDRWDLDKGNRVMGGMVTRCGVCRDNHIYQGFEEHLKKADMPESLVLAYNQFCLDTYDPKGFSRMKFKGLETKMEWLGKEVFCQLTHEIAYPSGFWDKLFEPDLPSIRKYKDRTDSICQQLRKGDITYGEAVYRWQQADLEIRQQLGPEMVKKVGKDLKNPIETLMEMFR